METSKNEWRRFERAWAAQMVESINQLRQTQKLTVAQLAELLRELGWEVSDATLSGMLSAGKRSSISVAELSIFARALNVSPLYILLGLPASQKLPDHKFWDGLPTDIYNVYSWLRGEETLRPDPHHHSAPGTHEAAASSELTLNFMERTTSLSRLIWTRLAEITVLEGLNEASAEWRLSKLNSTRSTLVINMASLRRQRRMFLDRAAVAPLMQIEVLPLPKPLEFIDSDLPLKSAVDEMRISEIAPLLGPGPLEVARHGLFEAYEQYLAENTDGGD